MNAEQLKNSILQRAIEGKLVEQREEEGTAAELLREIKAEKARLVKEGKLKKEKPLPEIKAEEIPFEIPESWEWVRLGDLLNSLTDGTHKTPKYTASGVPFLSVKNMSSRFLSFENTKFISQQEHEELTKRCHPQKGDMLLSKVGTTGIPVIIDTDKDFSIFVSIALLKYSSYIYAPYLLRAIESPHVQEQCKLHTRGVGNKNWVLTDIANTTLPLPPLAEQKRIVAKIEELLPHVEQYGKAHDELTALNEKFPDAMKKSVLQFAMEGKLVEQREEEGTAKELLSAIKAEKAKLVKEGKLKKEKPLPEIKAEEIPFEIPESWEWVRLGDVCVSIADGDHQPPPQTQSGIPFLVISNVSSGNLSFDNTRFVPLEYYNALQYGRIPAKGDILFTVTGSYGIPVLIDTERAFCFQRHISLLKLHKLNGLFFSY